HGLLRFGQVEGDLAAATDYVDRDRHQLTCFLDSRTMTRLPLAPGMAPLMSRRLSSLRTSTSSSPAVVTRSPPRRPAIFLPLKTRAAFFRWPMEPGWRCFFLVPWL